MGVKKKKVPNCAEMVKFVGLYTVFTGQCLTVKTEDFIDFILYRQNWAKADDLSWAH